MAEIVVADASPIIALARIEQLELLPRLFSRAILPLSVYRETQRRPELPDAQSTRLQQSGYYLATGLVESVLRRHGELT